MQTVAILGASTDRSKFGNKAVRAFMQKGFRVFPVNPKEAQIEGLQAFRTIQELPERPDWISVYVPPTVLLRVLPEIQAKGCDTLWLNPGTESDAVLKEAAALGVNVSQGCSILAIGVSPAAL